jgi:AraC family transcriptional regulator
MTAVDIREIPELVLWGLPHHGPCDRIGPVFEKLAALLGEAGLMEKTTLWAGVYHDDPATTAPEALRGHACCGLAEGVAPPPELDPVTIPAARTAVLSVSGDYAGLAGAWNWLYSEWLPDSEELAAGPAYEVYLRMAPQVPVEGQLTEIRLPLA